MHQQIENSYFCNDIKEEIKNEASVDDPHPIHQEIENRNICDDMKKDIKEEESVEDTLTNQHELGK